MNKLFRYLAPIWWEILIAVVLIGLQAWFALLIPSFMSNIMKIMESSGDYTTSIKSLITIFSFSFVTPTGDRVTDILIIGGIMIAFALGFLICALASSILVSMIGAYFGKSLRHDIFNKVAHYSVSSYDKFGTASLITRTTNDIEQTQQVIQMGLRIVIMAPTTLIIAVMMILNYDPSLALIVACSIPLIVIIVVVLFAVANPLFQKNQAFIDKLTVVFRESLTGVRVVRAFNQQKREEKRFDDANKDLTDISIRVFRVMSFASPIISIIFDITYIAVYFYGFAELDGQGFTYVGGTFVIQGIQFDHIIVSAQYAMQIMQSFMMFSMLLILLPRGQACAKRINAVLEEKDLIVDPAIPEEVESTEGVVEFKDVAFTFPGAVSPTLSSISFKTKPGSTTAIIGSTGSGKSTVINLIPRFYDVSSGVVLVDGVDVRKYSQVALREKIGFVPQTALLFTGTIRSNLAFGKSNATMDEINEALTVAQAAHFVGKSEKGIDQEVEEGGKNFSGGQKQRLCIARALVKKPEIYIFDDSFSALDFKTDIQLRTALKKYTQKSSVIIVAQRVSTILDANDIIVLNDGKIVGEGTHQDLLKTCQVYREIVYSQLDPEEIEKTLRLATEAAGGDH
jgi:ATP-binding cassette, subfamily B, multidrug efflux pump